MCIDTLREVLNKHLHAYHVLDAPTISDAEYDLLFNELLALEKVDPSSIPPDSPSQRVGAAGASTFAPVDFSTPMYSLNNAFSKEEVAAWDLAVRQSYGDPTYTAEAKFDGLAIQLRYDNGFLTEAATRGDGQIGEDVTANVRTIKSIPLRLTARPPPAVLEVVGEIVMTKSDFHALNARQRAQGLREFVNPRNAAAGSLRQKDPAVTSSRKLSFFTYAIGGVDGSCFMPSTQIQTLEWCKSMGLPVFEIPTPLKSEELGSAYDEYAKRRSDLPFEIDGVVFKVNEFKAHLFIGWQSRAPKWAIAHKFPAEQARTKVSDITVQVGRTGAITPVARLLPVFVGGVVVTNATLHNEDELRRKDIWIGDTVIMQRAGDVVPELVRVVHEDRPDTAYPFTMPTHCPSCASPIVKPEGEAVARCSSDWVHCLAQRAEALAHFVSRKAMNIDGLGPALIEQLISNQLAETPTDFYRLTKERLLTLDRMAEKSAQNILDAIAVSKTTTLQRFLYALGIRHVGENTSKQLATHFKDIRPLMRASAAQLLEVKDVGAIVAASVSQFFSDNRELIEHLLAEGINWPQAESLITYKNHPLKGKTFVLTGSFVFRTREQLTAMLERVGAIVTGSVSKKTDYVVAGSNAGSKATKAASLEIPVLSEHAVMELINKEPE